MGDRSDLWLFLELLLLVVFQPIEACQTMKTHGTSFINVVSMKFFMLGDVGTVTLA